MASTYQLRIQAEEAQRQAAGIARYTDKQQIRDLAMVAAETARITAELAKKVRNLED